MLILHPFYHFRVRFEAPVPWRAIRTTPRHAKRTGGAGQQNMKRVVVGPILLLPGCRELNF